jgi:hypothetical protein
VFGGTADTTARERGSRAAEDLTDCREEYHDGLWKRGLMGDKKCTSGDVGWRHSLNDGLGTGTVIRSTGPCVSSRRWECRGLGARSSVECKKFVKGKTKEWTTSPGGGEIEERKVKGRGKGKEKLV